MNSQNGNKITDNANSRIPNRKIRKYYISREHKKDDSEKKRGGEQKEIANISTHAP